MTCDKSFLACSRGTESDISTHPFAFRCHLKEPNVQSPERDLCFLSATTLAADLGARKVSPVEVIGAVIDHI
jgi:hypothetical protein